MMMTMRMCHAASDEEAFEAWARSMYSCYSHLDGLSRKPILHSSPLSGHV